MVWLETVAIVNPKPPHGRMVINLRDFDPETMQLWDAAPEAPPPAPEDPPAPEAPTDPAERLDAIVVAIQSLDEVDPELWTKGGKPQVSAIEAVLGWEISGAERDEAWARLEAE